MRHTKERAKTKTKATIIRVPNTGLVCLAGQVKRPAEDVLMNGNESCTPARPRRC